MLIFLLTYIITYVIVALLVWFFDDKILTFVQSIKSVITFFFSVIAGMVTIMIVSFDLDFTSYVQYLHI